VEIVNPSTSTVTIDGIQYDTVIIGNREWICSNLKNLFDFTLAFDGTDAPQATWHDEDSSKESYGLLYNGYAALQIDSKLSDGWRVAVRNDYTSLNNIQNGICYIYGTSLWNNLNLKTNAMKLNILPYGYAYGVSWGGNNKGFYGYGSNLTCWNTAVSSDNVQFSNFTNSNIAGGGTYEPKTNYFYIRLCRDVT
jgi:uncharacterized protein (TIGR02145 family)